MLNQTKSQEKKKRSVILRLGDFDHSPSNYTVMENYILRSNRRIDDGLIDDDYCPTDEPKHNLNKHN